MSNQPINARFPAGTRNQANNLYNKASSFVTQNSNDTNTLPTFDYVISVDIRILEQKIAACLFQHPGETIVKMDELKTYPESDFHAAYFWKKVKENKQAIVAGGYEHALPILMRCLYDEYDTRVWDSQFYTQDLDEIYEHHLLDMPRFIQTLKEWRVLLKLYLKYQSTGGYERLTRGYL